MHLYSKVLYTLFFHSSLSYGQPAHPQRDKGGNHPTLWSWRTPTGCYISGNFLSNMLSRLRLVMLFDRSMDTEDDLVFCTFQMSATSNVSFSIDLIDFLTSCFICFKWIALCHFITLRYIGSLFVLEYHRKRSRKLHLKEMKQFEQTLFVEWLSTLRNN